MREEWEEDPNRCNRCGIIRGTWSRNPILSSGQCLYCELELRGIDPGEMCRNGDWQHLIDWDGYEESRGERVLDQVQEIMERRGDSIPDVAKRIGLSRSWLNHAFHGESVGPATIKKLESYVEDNT